MKERINKNEEKLDNIISCVKELEISLKKLNNNIRNIELLNKYYGSKSWFKDKELVENGTITDVKSGVLSEDAVWNLNESINDLIVDLQNTINQLKNIKY